MSDSEVGFKHIYLFIEQPDPTSFGMEMAKALNEIEKRHGNVIHVSTQVLPGFNAGQTAWTGQIICRIQADLLGSHYGIFPREGGFIDAQRLVDEEFDEEA